MSTDAARDPADPQTRTPDRPEQEPGRDPRQDGEAPDPNRWRALVVCLVAGFMTLLDVSIVNVALPSMAEGLDAGANALQWVVSGYALAFGLALVPAGRLGDARGRKRAFQLGLLLFVLASVACGLAPSPGWLVGARLVQGLAGGLLTPQVSGLLQQLFRGSERAKAFGLLGASIGLSTAVGPVLGGLLIAAAGPDLGWRLVFFVNLPVGVVALLLAQRLVPHDRSTGRSSDVDPLGVLLLGAALSCVLLALIQQRDWGSARLLLYPVGAVLLVLWVLHERSYGRDREALVDLDLFSRPGYSGGATIAVLFFSGFTGVFFVYSQYLQGGLRYGALGAGLAVLPFAVGSAGAAAAGGRLVTRFGRPVVVAGLLLSVAGFAGAWLAALLVDGRGVVWASALPLLVAGIGSGLVITPNITLTLQEVPVQRAGTAGGVLQTGQRVGAAAGIAVTGTVFYAAGRDVATGYAHSMVVVTGLVALALVVALLEPRLTDR